MNISNTSHFYQSILVTWFLECRRSPLPSLVWPLPICLDSWIWHSRFLSNNALYSIRPCFSHQLENEMATHSSILAWRIPWMEESGRLESMGSQRVGHQWATSLSLSLSITSRIHSWVLFLLWLYPFVLSGVISPLISSSILGTYWPGEFPFQYPIILPFHTVHGLLKSRILKWFAIPFSSGPHSVRPLHHDPSVLGGPTWHGLVLLS